MDEESDNAKSFQKINRYSEPRITVLARASNNLAVPVCKKTATPLKRPNG
jgi:hypothetical protein